MAPEWSSHVKIFKWLSPAPWVNDDPNDDLFSISKHCDMLFSWWGFLDTFPDNLFPNRSVLCTFLINSAKVHPIFQRLADLISIWKDDDALLMVFVPLQMMPCWLSWWLVNFHQRIVEGFFPQWSVTLCVSTVVFVLLKMMMMPCSNADASDNLERDLGGE